MRKTHVLASSVLEESELKDLAKELKYSPEDQEKIIDFFKQNNVPFPLPDVFIDDGQIGILLKVLMQENGVRLDNDRLYTNDGRVFHNDIFNSIFIASGSFINSGTEHDFKSRGSILQNIVASLQQDDMFPAKILWPYNQNNNHFTVLEIRIFKAVGKYNTATGIYNPLLTKIQNLEGSSLYYTLDAIKKGFSQMLNVSEEEVSSMIEFRNLQGPLAQIQHHSFACGILSSHLLVNSALTNVTYGSSEIIKCYDARTRGISNQNLRNISALKVVKAVIDERLPLRDAKSYLNYNAHLDDLSLEEIRRRQAVDRDLSPLPPPPPFFSRCLLPSPPPSFVLPDPLPREKRKAGTDIGKKYHKRQKVEGELGYALLELLKGKIHKKNIITLEDIPENSLAKEDKQCILYGRIISALCNAQYDDQGYYVEGLKLSDGTNLCRVYLDKKIDKMTEEQRKSLLELKNIYKIDTAFFILMLKNFSQNQYEVNANRIIVIAKSLCDSIVAIRYLITVLEFTTKNISAIFNRSGERCAEALTALQNSAEVIKELTKLGLTPRNISSILCGSGIKCESIINGMYKNKELLLLSSQKGKSMKEVVKFLSAFKKNGKQFTDPSFTKEFSQFLGVSQEEVGQIEIKDKTLEGLIDHLLREDSDNMLRNFIDIPSPTPADPISPVLREEQTHYLL